MKTTLKTPDNIYQHTGKDYVAIDSDIAEVIQHIWNIGIITYKSGGGETPWLQIHDEHSAFYISLLRDYLNTTGKNWTIFQWCLSVV